MINPAEYLEKIRTVWERKGASGQGPQPRVMIDWAAYFKAFCEQHGMFPLMYAGRLLFPDGWRYGLDHEGPEWPPPEDKTELHKLQRAYWKLRKSAIRKELIPARIRVQQYEQLIATHSVMPIQRTIHWDEEAGKLIETKGPIDLEAARQRVTWLEDDLALCELKNVDPEAEEQELLA